MPDVESHFDRRVESVYLRTRSRYHWLLIGGTIFSAHIILAPLFVLMLGPLWTENVGEWPGILLIFEIATLAGAPALFWVVTVHHATLISHLRGDPDVDPVRLWVTSVAELPKGVLQGLVGYMVPLLVANAYVSERQDSSAVALVATSLALVITMLGAGSFVYLFWEIALRPVVREIAPRLPDDLVLRESGLTLAIKLLFFMSSLSLASGVAVGAASSNPSWNHDTRLLVTVGSAMLMSSTLAGGGVWMIEHSFVSRIDELRRALQSFSGGGRRDVRLPPLAGDDLDQVGHAFNEMVQRINLHDTEMQASRARLVAVTDDERRRMERDLHDGAQQHLALLNLQLSALERSVKGHPKLAADVSEIRATLAAASTEIRDLAHGIYPAVLENDGLAAALAEAAVRAAVPTRLEVSDTARASREIETAVYFCCLEALQNASKHAGDGATATITLARQNGTLHFTVADDGVGFSPEIDGHGLNNMRDRIGALGGEVSIDASPGRGVTVHGSVPVAPALG